jgi:hypothetical protein
MNLYYLLICFTLIITRTRVVKSLKQFELDLVVDLINHFELRHPSILYNNIFIGKQMVEMMKILHSKDHFVQIFSVNDTTVRLRPSIGVCVNIIILDSIVNIANHIKSDCKILVFSGPDIINEIISTAIPEINHEVYYIDVESLVVYDAYKINDQTIITKLGTFQDIGSNYTFLSDSVNSSFLKRRSDFNGITLNAMVEIEKPTLWIVDPDYKNNVPYHAENDTYDVTGLTNGIFHETLMALQAELNFSTNIYKRQDGIWGLPQVLPNGDIELTGMLENIVNGTADMIVASLAILPERAVFLDYLPPITSEVGALYIKQDDITEYFEMWTFIYPLASNLWLMMVVFASFVTFLVYVIVFAINKPTKYLICSKAEQLCQI